MKYTHADALKYIDILQSCIARMASNSEKCKTWCITIVAALIALFVKGEQVGGHYVVFIPIAFLWFLDAYYLYLEEEFREIYGEYIELYSENNIPDTTYRIDTDRFKQCRLCKIFSKVISVSTLPVYGFLTIALLIAIYHSDFMCLFVRTMNCCCDCR